MVVLIIQNLLQNGYAWLIAEFFEPGVHICKRPQTAAHSAHPGASIGRASAPATAALRVPDRAETSGNCPASLPVVGRPAPAAL
jgi:hypothetical protein